MIDVQFDTVLLSPATANAVKVVSTEHVVAHGSRDLSVLGIVGYGTERRFTNEGSFWT